MSLRPSRRPLAIAAALLVGLAPAHAWADPCTDLAEAWLAAEDPARALAEARSCLGAEGAGRAAAVVYVEAGARAGHGWALAAEVQQLAARDPSLGALVPWTNLRLSRGSGQDAAFARLGQLAAAGDELAALLHASALIRAGRPAEAVEPARRVPTPAGRRALVEACVASGDGAQAARVVFGSLATHPRHPEVAAPLWAPGMEPVRDVRGARREALAAAGALLASEQDVGAQLRAWQVFAWARERDAAARAAAALARLVPGLALPARLPYGAPMLRSLGEGLAQSGQAHAAGPLTPREEAAIAAIRARALGAAGQGEAAREAFAAAVALAPDDPVLLLDAAEATSDPEAALAAAREAEAAIARAVDLGAGRQRELLARALGIEARLLAAAGRADEALARLLAAALAAPGADTALALAEAQLAAGARERALEGFAAAAAHGSEAAALRLEALYPGPASPDALIEAGRAATPRAAEPAIPAPRGAAHLALELATPTGELRLADWRGEAIVLAFWASWCRPCREELPALASLAGGWTRAGLPVRVLAVSVDEDEDGWRRGLARYGDLGLALAWSPALGEALEIRALPALRVLDREGRVAGSLQGYDPAQTERLDALVRGL